MKSHRSRRRRAVAATRPNRTTRRTSTVRNWIKKCEGCAAMKLADMPKEHVSMVCPTCRQVRFETVQEGGFRLLFLKLLFDAQPYPRPTVPQAAPTGE